MTMMPTREKWETMTQEEKVEEVYESIRVADDIFTELSCKVDDFKEEIGKSDKIVEKTNEVVEELNRFTGESEKDFYKLRGWFFIHVACTIALVLVTLSSMLTMSVLREKRR